MKGSMIDTAKPGPTFDAESMRAILDGRKTQTRRVIKNEMLLWANPQAVNVVGDEYIYRLDNGCTVSGKLPYRIGQVYYARESLEPGEHGLMTYRADGEHVRVHGQIVRWPSTWKDRPTSSFAMPRWAARVFLRITDVRVQRLREISLPDILAEGVEAEHFAGLMEAWITCWERVNGKGSWERDRNKWTAAYTFEILNEGV